MRRPTTEECIKAAEPMWTTELAEYALVKTGPDPLKWDIVLVRPRGFIATSWTAAASREIIRRMLAAGVTVLTEEEFNNPPKYPKKYQRNKVSAQIAEEQAAREKAAAQRASDTTKK